MKNYRGSKDWKMKRSRNYKHNPRSTNKKFWKRYANKHYRKYGDAVKQNLFHLFITGW